MSSEMPEPGDSPEPTRYVCPQCGAEMPGPAELCWLCLNLRREKEPKSTTLREKAESTSFTFSLSTLMLAMTFVAVLLGLYTIAPDLATTLIVIAMLGCIRAARVVKLETDRKGPMSVEEKTYAIIASLGGTMLLGVLAYGVWIMVFCFFYSNPALGRGPIVDSIPLVAALCVFVFGLLIGWPRRKKSRRE